VPVYIVNPGSRLIRANTYSQAVNFAAKSLLTAEPVKADALVDMLANGAKVEDARAVVNGELPLENGSAPAFVFNPDPPNRIDARDLQVQAGSTYGDLPIATEHASAAENLDRIDEVLAEANAVDTVTLEGIDHVR